MDLGGRGGRTRDARRERMWLAAAGSVSLHALIVLFLLSAEGLFAKKPAREPRMRSYAVNIVSPPPTLRGPPPAEAPAPNVGGNAAPAPAPAAAPVPAPTAPPPPAAPTSAPQPPKPAPAPPKEPARTPQPTTAQPRPAAAPPRPSTPTPPQRPATTPTRPSPASGTNRATPPKPDAPAPTERRPGASNGPGSGAPSAGTGTRGAPTGRNPDPSSAGGEGLSVSQRGSECPSAGYCENIIRQVRRYFRRPDGSTGTAQVCFTVLGDGSVADDIDVKRVRGGFEFRMAVQEAVEQAGLRKAFGALPRAFGAGELPVCVDITPQT